MGTFIGHILPGVGFVLIGLWHVFNIIRSYVESPWSFTSRAWFPTRWSGWRRYIEPLAIMSGALASISAELFICPHRHQPLDDDWTIPRNHLNNFEHSTMSLFFLIYGACCLTSDITKIHLPRGLLHVMAAFAFGQELMLFYFHSADHMGLEGHFHSLLLLPITLGLICTVAEIAAPKFFIVSFVRALTILFQGFWFIQMGLALYLPAFNPKGCSVSQHDGHKVMRCGEEDDLRAKALANLAFSWLMAATLISAVGLYVGLMYHKSRHVQYEPLETNLKIERSLKDMESQVSPEAPTMMHL